MSVFSEQEREFLIGQMLGRIATVNGAGQPHVVPVGFRYNPDTDSIDIGGYGVERTKKFRDAAANSLVAFVIDDLASVNPWIARGVEVRGRAEVFTDGGKRLNPSFGKAWIRITPERVVSWGLNQGSLPPKDLEIDEVSAASPVDEVAGEHGRLVEVAGDADQRP